MDTLGFESLILFVSDLEESRAFYAGGLGLPVVFEDDVIVVVGGPAGRMVLHRNDRGHDERGIFPAGDGVGGRRSVVLARMNRPNAGPAARVAG